MKSTLYRKKRRAKTAFLHHSRRAVFVLRYSVKRLTDQTLKTLPEQGCSKEKAHDA
ncbi:hypothetical protein CLOLEP_02236 [[Clostridium] leptum DSM 753]|jgi:hypothetical protein|uniref:Uncharacterized protein n=1 Tax=[Clostridium] leptum DSM 753 TaxID=428125 RepID=A7VUJ0_9FIRM|nr:hypothetical protein CLOLEP_02236 [[Clostridium] leptum DSM 753]